MELGSSPLNVVASKLRSKIKGIIRYTSSRPHLQRQEAVVAWSWSMVFICQAEQVWGRTDVLDGSPLTGKHQEPWNQKGGFDGFGGRGNHTFPFLLRPPLPFQFSLSFSFSSFPLLTHFTKEDKAEHPSRHRRVGGHEQSGDGGQSGARLVNVGGWLMLRPGLGHHHTLII